ncbi:MAG: glutamine--fructose-6-phosphate transaminase (isomerizing) [Proteobacteria bacterium]|nr:glutamine--fructose-6-phosphate transaminase (isomerizing) [Pseudomonadota bacterium]
MCGVVGIVSSTRCVQNIFEGLQRLEYRGYDSAGIATLFEGKIHIAKSEGKLKNLEPLLSKLPQNSGIGMGHTRWATHGAPTTLNAHPHVTDEIALIHNGIIENYRELKETLIREGVKFLSETDSEVVLHLLAKELSKGTAMLDALKGVVKQLHGAYGLGVMWKGDPNSLYIVKQGSPVVIGLGKTENYFASDALALLPLTQKIIFLNDGEIGKITASDVQVWDFSGKLLKRDPSILNWSASSADKAGFRHYMLKEIHEQPAVIANTISRLVNFGSSEINIGELGLNELDLQSVRNIIYVACGTAHYSAMIAKYCVEQMTGIPVSVELASEFRYRDPYLNQNTLVIAVTQSGETADTLACIKHAVSKGCQTYSVCNVRFSSIPRACQATLYMEAGPEVGVASTKAFTSMVLCHYLFGMAFAQEIAKGKSGNSDNNLNATDKKVASRVNFAANFEALKVLPSLVDRAINSSGLIEDVAVKYYESLNCLFLGRGPSFMVALEGALKLKEISYIHAEGYAGGELKHGPIALVDKHMPIVAIAPLDLHYEKMISNIEEVRAREGVIIGVGDINDSKLKSLSVDFIPCPQSQDSCLQTILSVVPMQFLSYFIAVKRGTDVDQPRNLAKSVTVE